MSETDEQQRDRMYEEIAELCKKWRAEGIDPLQIATRMLIMSLAACEYHKCSCEQVKDMVETFYGLGVNERPKAKA